MAMVNNTPHTLSLQSTLQMVDRQLQELGSGPHLAQQAEQHKKLTLTKQKILQQIQGAMQGENIQSSPSPSTQRAPSVVMQAGSKMGGNSITMQSMLMKAPTASQKPVVLNKASISQQSMPSFIAQTNNTATRDKKLLDKKRLQDLVNEIDPNLQLDEDLEEMMMKVLSDFVDEAVSSSCVLAQHRKSNTLEVKDLKMHLEKQYKIFVPGFSSEDSRSNRKTLTCEAHKSRMALIRKANKK